MGQPMLDNSYLLLLFSSCTSLWFSKKRFNNSENHKNIYLEFNLFFKYVWRLFKNKKGKKDKLGSEKNVKITEFNLVGMLGSI